MKLEYRKSANAAPDGYTLDPATRKRIEDTGSIILGNTPAQFTAQVRAEYDVYKRVMAQQKLTAK